ncbi:toxin-antitoxin system YwqK family antitoxin [Reichenbachiella sp.]
MKYIFMLFFLVLLVGCEQRLELNQRVVIEERVSQTPLATFSIHEVFFNRKNSRWQSRKDSLYVSGYILEYFDNGQLAQKFEVAEGKKEGVLTFYYPNGLVKFEEHYKNNKLHGEVKRWSQEFGYQLLAQLTYKEGKLHGEQKKWFATGELHKVMQMKQGKEDGLQQAFRKNGALYANYEAKNGRVFGLKRSNLCYELDDQQVVYKD